MLRISCQYMQFVEPIKNRGYVGGINVEFSGPALLRGPLERLVGLHNSLIVASVPS
jgi:hypothetical protein